VVFRAGFGLFHGIIPSPLLMCQAPSCGGLSTYPGRPFENSLNANTGLFSFASSPFINYLGLTSLLTNATYPNGTPEPFCPDGTLASCGFLQDATIVRFDQNSKNPYGIQASASLEFQPFKDSVLSISGMHVRGVHLGSFYNVNQPDPSGTVLVHDSSGQNICKDVYFDFSSPLNSPGPLPPTNCTPYPAQMVIPGVPHINGVPGFRDPQYSVFFEATSRWDSVYDGLLVHMSKRLSHNFSYAISYTYMDRYLAHRGISPIALAASQPLAAAVWPPLTLTVTALPTPHFSAATVTAVIISPGASANSLTGSSSPGSRWNSPIGMVRIVPTDFSTSTVASSTLSAFDMSLGKKQMQLAPPPTAACIWASSRVVPLSLPRCASWGTSWRRSS